MTDPATPADKGVHANEAVHSDDVIHLEDTKPSKRALEAVPGGMAEKFSEYRALTHQLPYAYDQLKAQNAALRDTITGLEQRAAAAEKRVQEVQCQVALKSKELARYEQRAQSWMVQAADLEMRAREFSMTIQEGNKVTEKASNKEPESERSGTGGQRSNRRSKRQRTEVVSYTME